MFFNAHTESLLFFKHKARGIQVIGYELPKCPIISECLTRKTIARMECPGKLGESEVCFTLSLNLSRCYGINKRSKFFLIMLCIDLQLTVCFSVSCISLWLVNIRMQTTPFSVIIFISFHVNCCASSTFYPSKSVSIWKQLYNLL